MGDQGPPRGNSIPISFEFFPPRDAEQELILRSTWQKLQRLDPRCLSVTFGAGGSTQDATLKTVESLLRSSTAPVVPHVSCMVSDRALLETLLQSYLDQGVHRLVVLRGDRPQGGEMERPFAHASDLLAWIHQAFPGQFSVEVGCYPEQHPESASMDEEIRHFRTKVEAGADGAITQYFYDVNAYFDFVGRCRDAGIDIPITPGIMPITNYRQLAAFSARCGALIPPGLASRLEAFGDDGASIRAYGLDVVTQLCEDLLAGGAPGLHFYTLNRANATLMLWQRLRSGLQDLSGLTV
jgi:methylenetetrahydrofolate reductase (NADPH)